ncbi:MAG: AsmA family protein, partial [Paracoccaceae bacterium]
MRWIVRIGGILLGLVLLAVGTLALIPSEKIANIAVGQFNTLTGRTLTLTGAVRPSIWPQLGVKTGPVSMSNADWSDEGPMLQAEGLTIAVDLSALIAGEVRITAIEAITPRIVLERSANGEENWVFGGPSGGTVTTETPGVGSPFTLDRATISDGAITYIDHGARTRHALTAISGTVQIPSYTGPADLQIAASLNGQSFTADTTISAFQDFLDGRLVDLDLTLQASDARIAFDGRAGTQPLMAEGQLDADLGNLTAIAALAGIERPALPQGLGAEQIAITGAVTLTPETSVHLRGGTVTLDTNTFNTEMDLSTAGEKPSLAAQIRAGALNLAALAGESTGTATPATGWSRDPIDASALNLLDATIAFTADSIDLGTATLGPTQTVMTLDRGRAVFDIARVTAYQG